MLSDVCTNSGADLAFEKFSFSINGSDDAVKDAMVVIHQIPFVSRAQYQIRVKIELANEHKEFVSGKKNGKINKIMGQSKFEFSVAILTLAKFYQATSRLSLTASMSTTSILMFAEDNTTLSRTALISSNKRCPLPYPSMSLTSTTSASSVSAANISNAS